MTLVILAIAAALQSPRPADQAPLPAAVQQAVGEIDAECRDSGGKPGASPRLVTQVDLTGDGITDYIMDLGYYNCEGAAAAVSGGQSGSKISLFVGAPGNLAKETYTATSPSIEMITKSGKKQLYIGVMGPECGQKNADKLPMARVEVCLRPLNWDASKHDFVLGPLSEKRPFKID